MKLEEYTAKIKEIGFKSFEIAYSGSGDSGCVDEITYELSGELPAGLKMSKSTYNWNPKTNRGGFAETEVELTDVKEFLGEFAYAYLEHHHGGWEIDDGQSGTITFDGVKILHEGQSYYTESTDISEEVYV